MQAVELEIGRLRADLINVLSSPLLTYDQTKDISTCGVYFIYKGSEIIYVGKTGRTGKVRLRELAVDYRSHTLNKKMLRLLLMTVFKTDDYPSIRKNHKKELIDSGKLTEERFVQIQAKVNNMIKGELMFKFHPISSEEVTAFEHFSIAVLNPKMND